jgi:hypothetical protein
MHQSEFRILAQFPNIPQQLLSIRILIRFFVRMIILVAFAAFSSIGFSRSLAALLGMSAFLSVVMGAVKHERPFDTALNYWDEAVAYAALFYMVSGFNHSAPL